MEMKIKRIHTTAALISKSHKFSFDCSEHSLDYNKDMNCFVIDKLTLVPMSNIREVLMEQVETPPQAAAEMPQGSTETAQGSTIEGEGIQGQPEVVKKRVVRRLKPKSVDLKENADE